MRRHWTIPVAVLALAIPAVLPTVAQAAGHVITNPAKITPRTPLSDLRVTIASKRTPRAVLQKILRVATIRKSVVVRRAVRAGCAGPVIHTARAYLYVEALTIGWRRVVQNEWCWDAHKITSHTVGTPQSGEAGNYCWTDESYSNEKWAGHPAWEYKVQSAGTLHVQAFWGCGWPLDQRNVNATLFYRVGGKFNCGKGNKPCSGR